MGLALFHRFSTGAHTLVVNPDLEMICCGNDFESA